MKKNRFTSRIKISTEILGKIARIDEFKGLWLGGQRFNPQILARLKSYVIITSTGASTRIEGANLNDDEIARLLRGLKSRKPVGRDEQEVAGYADLLDKIFSHWQILQISESQILQFHEVLLHFSQKDESHKGRYKLADNAVVLKNDDGQTVVLFRPTPPYLVKKEMTEVIAWANQEFETKELHPLIIIANFIFEFLAIHPFQDGNGRLSRALTNFLLLKNGYSYIPYVSLEEIIEDRKTDYYLSLRQTQKKHKTNNEDITPWLHFTLDTLLVHTQRAKQLMESQQPEQILSPKQLAVYQLFHGQNTASVLEIFRALKGDVPKITIKQALSRLVALGLIERIGLGRSTRYRKK